MQWRTRRLLSRDLGCLSLGHKPHTAVPSICPPSCIAVTPCSRPFQGEREGLLLKLKTAFAHSFLLNGRNSQEIQSGSIAELRGNRVGCGHCHESIPANEGLHGSGGT